MSVVFKVLDFEGDMYYLVDESVHCGPAQGGFPYALYCRDGSPEQETPVYHFNSVFEAKQYMATLLAEQAADMRDT